MQSSKINIWNEGQRRESSESLVMELPIPWTYSQFNVTTIVMFMRDYACVILTASIKYISGPPGVWNKVLLNAFFQETENTHIMKWKVSILPVGIAGRSRWGCIIEPI
jgi:hypothetical protein